MWFDSTSSHFEVNEKSSFILLDLLWDCYAVEIIYPLIYAALRAIKDEAGVLYVYPQKRRSIA